MEHVHKFLQLVSANNYALLYKCRWSKKDADNVVPQLAALLDHGIIQVHQEALRALHRIGPAAIGAAPAIACLTEHVDLLTRRSAVTTLSRVILERPSIGIKPLVAALNDKHTVHEALHGIIAIGSGAAEALPALIHAYGSSRAKTRRLAISAIGAVNPEDPDARELLDNALNDRSGEVRKAAEKAIRKNQSGA